MKRRARTAAQWNTPDDFGAELPAIPPCPSHILAGFAAQPQNRGKLKVVGAFFSNEITAQGHPGDGFPTSRWRACPAGLQLSDWAVAAPSRVFEPVPGGAEVVTVSSAGSSTSIPIAGTPVRLTHAAGATVQTATLGPLGPMT
jgi:hypothetical protein